MRRVLLTMGALLAGCTACLAQVSILGSTAMGLPSTPATIVTSPLNGPSPFSATILPSVSDTTLAPVPMPSDPTTPGTVVTCATPTGQIAPGTPTVTAISTTPSVSAMGTTIGTTPSVSAAPTTSALPPIATAPLPFSQQPEVPATTVFFGSTIPAPPPAVPPLPSPSITPALVPLPSTVPGTVSTTAAMTSSTTTMPSTPLGTIPSSIVVSTTGTISPVSPVGSSPTTVCSSTPGGPPTNGAALPLATPEIPSSPPPGTIQQGIAPLGGTSIDLTAAIIPTPNTPACAESMTMNLATPGTMAPANATGAAATPGVSPPGC
jgi:hypothetical protein